ncbi:DUF551 domain-containing protein [Burkholderia pseudomallei]|uniref:DUF551 domain-containing protein n=1 Tax=Burkholderia pseudomallei TaxID=28450 RepID=UPI000B038801|nr:DUF551 domain-containing protein [Burkholderia pseudomallei]
MKITDDMLTKWRKQFEAELQLEAALHAPEVALSRHDDGTYRVPAVQSAWWGYQAGRRTTTDREAWISADERLPEDDQVVLVAIWAYNKPDDERIILIARFIGSEFLNEATGEEMYRPTHWMLLPTTPTAASMEES